MAIWLCRAGKTGEYENKFLEEQRIYLTWDELDKDIKKFSKREDLIHYLMEEYEDMIWNRARNWTSQIWPFVNEVNKGDWVILPSKFKSSIYIGEIKSDYKFDLKLGSPYYHYREVNWFASDITRTNLILFLFSRFDRDPLIDLLKHLRIQTFAEVCHQGMVKRRPTILKSGESNEVLQIWIFRQLFQCFTIRELQALLDDNSS